MFVEQKQSVFVFFSYEKRDKRLRDRLEDHLSDLRYRGLITTWHDRTILAGEDRLQQIDASLEKAQIILLLISANFMASDYCYGREMQQALRLHAQQKAAVIPILLRPVVANSAPFRHLSMLPTNGKPVTGWRDRDSAFVDVVLGIEKAAERYVASVHDVPLKIGESLIGSAWNELPYEGTSRQNFPPGREKGFNRDLPLPIKVVPPNAARRILGVILLLIHRRRRLRREVELRETEIQRFTEEKHWQQAEEQRRKRAYYLKNIEIYRRAVDNDPRDELAWRGLGNSYYALAKYADALDAFQHALLSQPTASACAGAGNACARLTRYAEAITFYSSALKLDQDVTLNYSDYIHALQATGKASEAVQMQAQASELGYFDDDDEIE
jgi:tetratricopeptide (TPR) repeat protein